MPLSLGLLSIGAVSYIKMFVKWQGLASVSQLFPSVCEATVGVASNTLG